MSIRKAAIRFIKDLLVRGYLSTDNSYQSTESKIVDQVIYDLVTCKKIMEIR